MKLLGLVLLLFALAHSAPPAVPAHTYVTPACHGIANIPGYETCSP